MSKQARIATSQNSAPRSSRIHVRSAAKGVSLFSIHTDQVLVKREGDLRKAFTCNLRRFSVSGCGF